VAVYLLITAGIPDMLVVKFIEVWNRYRLVALFALLYTQSSRTMQWNSQVSWKWSLVNDMLDGKNKKNTARQLSSFTFVGLAQYVLDAALLYALLFWSVEIIVANLLSRTVIGFVGFYANRSITFRDTDVAFLQSFLRFLFAWVVTSALSTLGIMLAISLFIGSYPDPLLGMLVKLIVEALVFFVAFFIQKLWIFES